LHNLNNNKKSNYGILYVVATPIGNINDITYRAVEVLSNSHIIATENTKHSKRLLNFYGINTKLISYHKHNEALRCEYLINLLLEGKNISLISDAGTPSISDPGDYIVASAHKMNINVSPIPGASSLTAAISVSGFASKDFKFVGFLPKKTNQKINVLKKSKSSSLIFFESPNRILATLNDLERIYTGEKKIMLAREITKVYEDINYDSIKNQLHNLLQNEKEKLKGEFVIVIPKNEENNNHYLEDEVEEFLKLLLENSISYNSAIKITCKHFNIKKNNIYKKYINLAND